MSNKLRETVFDIDGYQVSVSFAGEKNTDVLGQVKQILLSSFTNNVSRTTLPISLTSQQGESMIKAQAIPVHLENLISAN